MKMKLINEKDYKLIAQELYIILQKIIGNEYYDYPGSQDILSIGDELNKGVELIQKYKEILRLDK